MQDDGVHRNGQVWLNGKYVGEHKGYPVGFRFNLTPYLQQDEEQVLVIAVDSRKRGGNEQGGDDALQGTFDITERGSSVNPFWGGIYESVWVEATAENYVEQGSVQALEDRSWTAPSLVDGRAYLRNHTEMVVYELGSPAGASR